MSTLKKSTREKYIKFLVTAFPIQWEAERSNVKLPTDFFRKLAKAYKVGNEIWFKARKLEPTCIEEINDDFVIKMNKIKESNEKSDAEIREEIVEKYSEQYQQVEDDFKQLYEEIMVKTAEKIKTIEQNRRVDFEKNNIPFTPYQLKLF